jgi:hypothetical protein
MAVTFPNPTYTANQIMSPADMNVIGDNLNYLRGTSGTFTPTYYGSTTAGTTTYTFQRGTYRTEGDILFFSARISWTGATGTGSAVVGGLPIVSRATNDSSFVVLALNHTFTGSGMIGYMYGSVNVFQFVSPISGGTANVAIDTAGEILISGFYFI